ncbi:MAG TPA: hypothetical protein VK469_19875, partial [Candidatus Kapabacteria bacterium]|nr:hypothetical protein [Candidatus Kapabacteria bacterium]
SKEFRTATRGIIISGIVTKYSDQKKSQTEALQGARMVASNNGGTTETDKNGKYNLNVMPGWAGTVTPSSEGFDFAPRDRFYSLLEADNGNQDFTGTPNTVVSGKMIYEGKGIEGVEIIFESIKGKTFFTETGEIGDYEYILPYNWMGIVIPKKEGHQFRPKQKVYGGITAQLEDENYMIEFPAISGRVTKSQSKSGLPGVTVTFSHINMDKFKYLKEYTVTDSEGHYINHIPTDWSGGIRPSKKGYIFYPRSEDNLTDDIDSPVDFKAERDFHLFFLLSGNILLPAESRFNKIYAKSLIFPGLTVGYKFNRHFYVWGGYSFFSKNGKSEIFKKPTKWKQSYLSLGLGYYRNKSIRVAWRVGLGAIYVNFSEAAFGDKVRSNVFGGSIEAAGIYKVGQRLFMEFLLGYRVAAKTFNETNVTLGGFSTALGLGLKL